MTAADCTSPGVAGVSASASAGPATSKGARASSPAAATLVGELRASSRTVTAATVNRTRSFATAASAPFGGFASHAGSGVFEFRIPCPSPVSRAASSAGVFRPPRKLSTPVISSAFPPAPIIAARRVSIPALVG